MTHDFTEFKEILEVWEMYRTPRWSYTRNDLDKVLRSALTADTMVELYRKEPDAFDLECLNNAQLTVLLRHGYKEFKDVIDINLLPMKHKVTLFLSNNKRYEKYIDFDELPRKEIANILRMKPTFIDSYPIPRQNIPVEAWLHLIGTRHKYLEYCVENLPSVKNKTDIRKFIKKAPQILNMVTVDIVQASVMSANEWVMVLRYDEVKAYGPGYQKEVVEWLREELTADILTGSAKDSLQLKKAIKLL